MAAGGSNTGRLADDDPIKTFPVLELSTKPMI